MNDKAISIFMETKIKKKRIKKSIPLLIRFGRTTKYLKKKLRNQQGNNILDTTA